MVEVKYGMEAASAAPQAGDSAASSAAPGNTVVVCWDAGVCTNYRCGLNDKHDLRLFDNAQSGVAHSSVTCDGCFQTPVSGIRWKCAVCNDFDLCSQCYMTDKHPTEHRFLRYNTPDSERFPLPPRSGAKRVRAKGFFKGATVVRGRDWIWKDQDGGVGNTGSLLLIRGWERESYRSVGEVQWSNADNRNIYRLGHRGKVDLKCKEVGEGYDYYVDHLPVLGAHPGPPADVPEQIMFAAGDKVKISLDQEAFRSMQEGHGGWNEKMNQNMGQIGTVQSVLESGDLRVVYSDRAWTVNPASLIRVGGTEVVAPPRGVGPRQSVPSQAVPQTSSAGGDDVSKTSSASSEAPRGGVDTGSSPAAPSRNQAMDRELGFHLFREGDVVRVLDDLAEVHRLQDGHGGWNDDIALSLGQLGRVVVVFDSGDCRVRVNGYNWTLNPKALTPAPGETPPDVPDARLSQMGDSDLPMHVHLLSLLENPAAVVTAAAAGDMDTLRNFLRKKPDAVDAKVQEKTALHVAVNRGQVDMVRLLLDYKASVNVQDEDGDRPLHLCAYSSEPEIAGILIQHGANPNLMNHRGATEIGRAHV